MAELIFIDSFDHYSTVQITRKWTAGGGAGGWSITAGRTGNGLHGGALDFPFKTFNAEYATLTAGIAYKTEAFANWIHEFSNVSPGVSLHLEHVGDGRLRFYFNGSFIGSPSTFVLSLNQWFYVEMQAEITAASPPHVIATARVNGVEVLAVDYTAGSGSAGAKWNRYHMEGPGGGLNCIYDDLYVTDTEYLGDVKIGVLYPNAAGDSSAWTPLSGANWSQVEEHPADDDTSYVSAGSVGLKDLYNLDDIDPAFTGTIKGVQSLLCVKKSDEGEAAVKGLWKSGATELTQSDGHNYLVPGGFYPSATAYLYNIETERVSLFTAVDWTASEINALQIGITRTI